MRDILMILNDYRKGTPEVRLNLFLFHRDLRREFSEIENDENSSLNGDNRGFNLFKKNKKRVTFSFRILKKKYQPTG
jgi:hypothetical protein